MVGLADIPIVGKVVERISDNTVDALFRGFRYVFCYKTLVDDLKSETDKLNIQMDNISEKIKEEKDNGKIIKGHVLKWQNDVEEIRKSAQEFSPSCNCIQRLPIPNPVSRFRIGRNAAKKAIAVAQLTATGKDHLTGGIANLPPVTNMPKPDTTFEEFESRNIVYKKLWDGLVNKDTPLVHGIYGMAGVGKTRLMEKIWEDAIQKKIFDEVVRVTVGGENLDKLKLQDQIAGRLDCHLESQDAERRASQLENSLRNKGKILLILDDVWREIPLGHIIGNLFEDGSSSNGSKILLTSREKKACSLNNCKHLVEIETLSPDEALDLFKKTVGPLPDQYPVKQVCDECGQLPLVILAVGQALKDKSHNSWADALNQLQKGKFKKIPGVDPRVYVGIKLSIDSLEHDDAKSCLFLCCLFPEDADIDMKMLIQLAIGSQLIRDGESRVLAMVDSLKKSSLLLHSGKDNKTKVHDIIRDVARNLASTDLRYAFLHVKCNSWHFPSDDADYCTGKFLRLDVETDDVHFEEHPVFPDMHSLWLQSNNHLQQFSGGFFRMFAKLRFLMLQNVNISLERFSLQPLDNLRTLILLKCDIRKTYVSLFPKKLETLRIWHCEIPSPMDVANLEYLQKLEIQVARWKPKLVMKSNVISSLSRLEELHIPSGYITDGQEFRYQIEPIVTEITELARLQSLQFQFYDDDTFQGRNVFSKIFRYNITVGQPGIIYDRKIDGKSIELNGNHGECWEGLMARSEEVILRENHVKVHLASISHDDIQHGATCFSQLTILKIDSCSQLKYLFWGNIAKCLVQLQQLHIRNCQSMEAIIMNEGTTDAEIISFPKLKLIEIHKMSRLASFYKKDPFVRYHKFQMPFFDGKIAFPSLEKLVILGLNTSIIWGEECYINDTLSSFSKLKLLDVYLCDRLEILFPHLMLQLMLHNLEYIRVFRCSSLRSLFPPYSGIYLKHLKELTVDRCVEMREIILACEQVITDDDGILFPELTLLKLSNLPSLRSFWHYQSGNANTCKVPLTLPQLSSIELDRLPLLTRLFHGANFEFHVPALEKVLASECKFLEHIFENVRGDKASDSILFSKLTSIKLDNLSSLTGLTGFQWYQSENTNTCKVPLALPQLSSIFLQRLPRLRRLFHGANFEFHVPALKEVKVFKCPLLEHIFEDVRGGKTSDMSANI